MREKIIISTIAVIAATSSLATTLPAYAGGHTMKGDMKSHSSALKKALIDDATPSIDIRYRYENVDQDSFANDADANTLRTKLGYKSGVYHDFTAIIEVENVTYLGDDDDFNNTVNGNTAFPTVADPDSTEINHAYLVFSGIDDTIIAVGRQPHNILNQRFVGTVGWRQNDQSYDSAAIINSSIEDTTLIASYVNNVNRINGDDHAFGNLDTSTQVLQASYAGWKPATISAYGVLIDLDASALASLSSKSFGIRAEGSTNVTDDVDVLYEADYARQTDHGDNTADYSANYYHLALGAASHGLTLKVGYEELGSDNGGTVSFQTPLATLHKFNGWADQFLATPATGLEDTYVSGKYVAKNVTDGIDSVTLTLVYHDFSADSGGADYGNEFDASLNFAIEKHYSILLKFADYDADTFSTDTQKLWLQLGAKF